VAVLGLGGPGHLGVQFAAKLGFKTVAIARGQHKMPLAGNSAPTTISTTPPKTPRRRCNS
jgi:D-arabinose 1-dehydrogenase-like Zn-dependent alcohol dehydrogenase